MGRNKTQKFCHQVYDITIQKQNKTKQKNTVLAWRSSVGLVAWLSWSKSRGLGSRPCRVMKWSQELPEESIKKHTRSKRGGHGFYTYRSSLQVSFWHLFKIYLRLIFPFSIFLQSVATLFVAKLTKLFLHLQEMNTTL